MPAEWHRQSGVQLTWPHPLTDWSDNLEDITRMFVCMTREIARRERVLIATPDPACVWARLRREVDETLHGNITVRACRSNDTWARDHALITLLPQDGMTDTPRLMDFRFNGWGGKFEAALDNDLSARLFFGGAFRGHLVSRQEFVLEGGAIESDGNGTLLTTSSCMMASHRNQPLTREEIGRRLCRWLGMERVLWVDHGSLEGDDTDGHIDTLVRFAPDDTLLYTSCDDPSDSHYRPLKAMEEQLRTFRTVDGRPYRLLPLPIPAAIYDGEDRLPATYANFLVINGAVLCPTYGQPDSDRRALETIAGAFPGRDIVGIDAQTAIRQHGSLHCLTMQFPEGVITQRQHKNKIE